MRRINFIAIDFETAKYSRESAISIGLAKYNDGYVVDTYYSLIRPPELYIRPDFTDLHGLSVDDVKDAPTFDNIWGGKIKPFIGGLPAPRLLYFCTFALARNIWPELESHALTALAENFGICYSAHNALDDAVVCGQLVGMAAEKLGN